MRYDFICNLSDLGQYLNNEIICIVNLLISGTFLVMVHFWYVWYISGTFLVHFWYISGTFLVHFWYISGTFLEYFWFILVFFFFYFWRVINN